MKRLITCLALLLGLSGAGYAQDAAPASHGLLVHVYCFSGRQDPEFLVTDPDQIAKIKALLDGCASRDASSADTPVITSKLGYNGIALRKLDDTSASLGSIYAIDVNERNVLVHSKQADSRGVAVPQKQSRTDASAALESYLLELAMGYGKLEARSVERFLRR